MHVFVGLLRGTVLLNTKLMFSSISKNRNKASLASGKTESFVSTYYFTQELNFIQCGVNYNQYEVTTVL